MYLYFDRQGVLRETINDGAVRQNDDEADTVYAYFEGDPLNIAVTLILQKPDRVTSNEYFMSDAVIKEIPYDKNRDLKYFEDYTPGPSRAWPSITATAITKPSKRL